MWRHLSALFDRAEEQQQIESHTVCEDSLDLSSLWSCSIGVSLSLSLNLYSSYFSLKLYPSPPSCSVYLLYLSDVSFLSSFLPPYTLSLFYELPHSSSQLIIRTHCCGSEHACSSCPSLPLSPSHSIANCISLMLVSNCLIKFICMQRTSSDCDCMSNIRALLEWLLTGSAPCLILQAHPHPSPSSSPSVFLSLCRCLCLRLLCSAGQA